MATARDFEKRLRGLREGESVADTAIPGLLWRRQTKGTYAQLRYRDPVTGKRKAVRLGRLAETVQIDGAVTLVSGTSPRMALLQKATEFAERVGSGIDPKAEVGAEGFTLEQAMELNEKRLRNAGKSERTIQFYRSNVERYFADWLRVPLRKITRTMLRERHEAITDPKARAKLLPKEKNARGRKRAVQKGDARFAANGAFRSLRTIWNTASGEDAQLGEFPRKVIHWHKERKRGVTLKPEMLSDWWKAVHALGNPVRRDYYLFVLFSGIRRNEAASLRWEHVDLDTRTVYIPEPKGGEDRAFPVPLSDFLVGLLRRRRKATNGEWVFPSAKRKDGEPRSKSGHIEEPKDAKSVYVEENGKRVRRKVKGALPSPHALRHTYIHVAESRVAIPRLHVKTLVNHSVPQDITEGYGYDPTDRALWESQQKITDALLGFCEGPSALRE